MPSSSNVPVFRFLTADQLIKLYNQHVVEKVSPSQLIMLQSAADAPINHKTRGGQNDIHQLAGILAYKIIKNHAYQDGNKRLATVAVDMFFKINHYKLQDDPLKGSHDKALRDIHELVAKDGLESEVLAALYKTIAKPLDPKKTKKSLLDEIRDYEKHAQKE